MVVSSTLILPAVAVDKANLMAVLGVLQEAAALAVVD
jgi:hypothetical protein